MARHYSLADLLDWRKGRLDEERVRAIELHIENCYACRRAAEDLKRIEAALPFCRSVELPAELERRIRRRLQSDIAASRGRGEARIEPRPIPRRAIRATWMRIAWSAAVSAAVIISATVVFQTVRNRRPQASLRDWSGASEGKSGIGAGRRPASRRGLDEIQNDQAEFRVLLWTNREDNTFVPEEEVRFFFHANRNCLLTLLDATSDGDVTVLFPNAFQPENTIQAGRTYQLPPEGAAFVFRIKKPLGDDLIKAIATLDDLALFDGTASSPAADGGFAVLSGGERKAGRDIGRRLSGLNPKRWAEAEKILTIIERRGNAGPAGAGSKAVSKKVP